jgi:Protein of unknown function (DUF4197)
MKKLTLLSIVLPAALLLTSTNALAQGKKARPKAKPTPAAVVSASLLSDEEVSLALKDALSNGVNRTAEKLGGQGGFYDHAELKIPMSPALEAVVSKLEDQKYGDLVDDFVVAMNRAAEQSIAESSFMVKDAIRQLKIDDPKSIVAARGGQKDAATQYFRRTSEKALLAKVTETVMTANSEAGALDKYNRMLTQAGGQYAPFDINEYVAQKMLDGVFLTMAAEEKRIREEPSARTTAALRKVFGK